MSTQTYFCRHFSLIFCQELCLSVYLRSCLFTFLSVYLSIYVPVCLFFVNFLFFLLRLNACLSVSIYFVNFSICRSTYNSVRLYFYLCVSPSLYLSICLSVFLPTILSVCIFTYVSVRLFFVNFSVNYFSYFLSRGLKHFRLRCCTFIFFSIISIHCQLSVA